MMQFLQAPVRSTIDFYEDNRMKLTWNIHLLLLIALLPLLAITAYTQSIYIAYYSISLLLIFASLIFMKRTGKYRIIAVYTSFVFYIMILISMFTVDEYIHYIEPFWALVIVLYVYFIHGKFWGGIAMASTIISTSLFFVFNLNITIGNLNELSLFRLLSMAFELGICLIMIGYILHQFIYLKNRAEEELRMMNQALRNEKELVESRNKEKTIMLQEIHHRVKNNLQIVTSLLRMQASKIESPEAKEHFNDAINRVLTMSLIHQKLYESDNLSAVDLSEYIESLTTDVLRSTLQPRTIDTSFSIEVPAIGMKTIVPLALIITELISNSIKHAFAKTAQPKIELDVRIQEGSELLELVYSDNGLWKESDEDSFGSQLIEALTEQLDGTYELDVRPQNGSHYSFLLKQLD